MAADDALRRRLLLRGRVQGVWFRDSCAREARARRVQGWARNLEDGRVEVVLEGAPDAVTEVERWCHSGPTRAVVTEVLAFTEPVEGITSFRIR